MFDKSVQKRIVLFHKRIVCRASADSSPKGEFFRLRQNKNESRTTEESNDQDSQQKMPPKDRRGAPGAMLDEVPPSTPPRGGRLGKGGRAGTIFRGCTVMLKGRAGDRLARGKTDPPGGIGKTFMKAHRALGRVDLMSENTVRRRVPSSDNRPLPAGKNHSRQGAEQGESQNRFGSEGGKLLHDWEISRGSFYCSILMGDHFSSVGLVFPLTSSMNVLMASKTP